MTAVVTDLDVDAVLHRLLATAAEMTGARYAAVGVLDERRAGLERFVTYGVSDAVRREIGRPEGPRPARCGDRGPAAAARRLAPRGSARPPGFRPAIRRWRPSLASRSWSAARPGGTCTSATRPSGEPFTEADEESVVMLAGWAGIAIDNARNYESSERRRGELERTVRRLEATTAIARAVGGETDSTGSSS